MPSCAFAGTPFAQLEQTDRPDPASLLDMENRIHQAVLQAVERGFTDFYTCLGAPFDVIAAERLLAIAGERPGPKLHCVLPSEVAANGWPEFWRERYFRVLERCHFTEMISLRQVPGADRKAYERIARRCDLVLTDFDGQFGDLATVIRLADAFGADIHHLSV